MKLAEALALRSDMQRSVASLRGRIESNARHQEGEPPAEDATALITEASATLDRLEDLIVAINLTNAATRLADGTTMTAALARRDVLRLRHGLLIAAADAGAGSGGYRQMRSELREVSTVNVPSLRRDADDVAHELRELDGRIQEANWTNDLQEGADPAHRD